MAVNYPRSILSTRIPNFYIIPINHFAKSVMLSLINYLSIKPKKNISLLKESLYIGF